MTEDNGQIKGIGKRIKELREKMGMTQSDLSERLGGARSLISTYEQETRMPSYSKLIKLAEVFNVSTDYLLGYEPEDVLDLSGLDGEKRSTVERLVNSMK